MSHHHCDQQEQTCASDEIVAKKSEKPFTLRLTFVEPKTSKRHVQCISSLFSSSPVEQLLQICGDMFKPWKQKEEKMELFLGFPPKPLHVDDENEKTLGDCGITSQMNIMVKFVPEISINSKVTSITNSETAAASASVLQQTSTRPARRAAAIAANETFIEVDKAMKNYQQPSPKKTKRSTATSNNTGKKTRITGEGRTLSTGQVVISAASTGKKKSTSSLQSEEDVTTALLSAVTTNNSSKLNSILRKGMKNAVLKSYEESKANIRLTAFQHHLYTMTPFSTTCDGAVSQDNDSSYNVGTFHIMFSKGLEGRGTFTDTIEILSKDTLEAVIRAVYKDSRSSEDSENNCMLKPIYMSQVSPRVFWSLAYHYPQYSTIEEALRDLCNDLDWHFIEKNKRTRMLSEKAKENLRQQNRKHTTTDSDDEAAAVDVITQVEQAMEAMIHNDNSHTSLAEQRRLLMANAAYTRIQTNDTNITSAQDDATEEVWDLVTPCDEDIDEILECIRNGESQKEEDEQEHWLAAIFLMQTCHIHNWRELANSDETMLYQTFLTMNKHQLVTEKDFESWVDYAQVKSIFEIMMAILDGDEDIFIMLRDLLHSGTPKDLVMWMSIPNVFIQEINSRASIAIGEPMVKKWCHRAQIALNTYPWLDLYITPA